MSAFYIDHSVSPDKAVRALAESHDPIAFAQGIINDALNRLIADFDNSDLFSQLGGSGANSTAIPYAGWYWRDVDFFGRYGVTIAAVGGDTAVCENNKWGYDQRGLTDDERQTFLDLVWEAKQRNWQGGNLAEINRETAEALVKAGDFIRSLAVSS